jgi:hypothetical protein
MIWLVMIQVFLFSLLVIPSLAFFDLAVNFDEESGEMMKPSNWSDTRFQMLKMIRLRVRIIVLLFFVTLVLLPGVAPGDYERSVQRLPHIPRRC